MEAQRRVDDNVMLRSCRGSGVKVVEVGIEDCVDARAVCAAEVGCARGRAEEEGYGCIVKEGRRRGEEGGQDAAANEAGGACEEDTR